MRLPVKHRRPGLTVLEVIIAISLIVMLLGAMLSFFWQVLEVRDVAAASADRMQVSRQVLSRIAGELRGCVGLEQIGFPIDQPLVEEELLEEGEFEEEIVGPVEAGSLPLLVGNRRNITFLTTALPAEHQYAFFDESLGPPPAQHDLTQVSYWLWVDEETDEDGEPVVGGIVRTEKKTLNQYLASEEELLEVRNDLWSHELGYLEFRYFDGVEWSVTWDVTTGNSLPQLIQVTVGFGKCTSDELDNRDLDEYPIEEFPYGDDQYHPDRYSVIVRIPAADKFYSSRVNNQIGKQLSDQLDLGGLP